MNLSENGIEATARGVVERVRDGSTKSGKRVIEVSLDCSRMYNGKKQHSYCSAKFYGEAGERALNEIRQGDVIRVSGSPGARAYVNKNNETKSILELTCFRGFEILRTTDYASPEPAYNQQYGSAQHDQDLFL